MFQIVQSFPEVMDKDYINFQGNIFPGELLKICILRENIRCTIKKQITNTFHRIGSENNFS